MSGYVDPYGFSKGGGSKSSSPSKGYTDPYSFKSGGAKPSSGGGFLGLIGNLGSDVKGAVEGLPTGVAHLAGAVGKDTAYYATGGDWTHKGGGDATLKATEPVVQSYKQTYSPLFHGKFGQFAHDLYGHPLGPILDALTVLTAGAGGVAKAGGLLAKAGAISDTSRLANLSKVGELTVPDFGAGEPIAIKQTASNPLIRLRQTTVNKGLNALPSETPVFGSTARGVRALTRQPERAAAALQGAAQRATTTFNQLTAPERVAFHLSARGLTPSTYLDYLAKGGEKIPAAVTKALSDPKVSQLLETPTPRLGAALAEGRKLSDHLTALRVAGGHLDETTALESPYRHLRIVNGATRATEDTISPALKAATAERDVLAAAHEKALAQEAKWRTEGGAQKTPGGATVPDALPASNPLRNNIVTLGHQLEAAQSKVDRLSARPAHVQTGALVDKPGRDLATLIKEQGDRQPFHVKDSAHTSGLRGRFSSRPSGYAAPLQGVKQSQGVLFSKGLINFKENSVVRDYHAFSGQARAQLIHDELVKHAAILPKGEPIPHGYEELKLNRGQATAPYATRATAPLQHELAGQSLKSKLADLSRQSLEEANPEAPHRLIVPTQVRKIVEDNSVSHASTLRKLAYTQPTNVWKHLILGLRPAFFGNITIGNSILGTLQMAPGRWGVVGWLNQVLPGFEKIAGPKLSVETMQHVFPEQAYGTFGHSMGFSPNPGLKVAQKAWQGVMPATIAYENVLRRAMAEGWAKADPHIQAVMRRTGGDINSALPAVLKSHPHIISGISRRVDDALGNYRTYNRLERALKAVIPFWGWQRHLTSSVVRLALERPQTLDALFQTGETGKPLADKIAGALAEYLHGSLGVHLPSWLGGVPGKQQLLSMTSLNPFNTLVDEQNMVAGAFGKPGAQSGAWPLNPIAQAAIEQLTGTDLLTGHPAKGNRFAYGLENATPLEGLVRDYMNGGRPTMTQGKHPHPTTNQNNEYAQLLRYLGLPVINVNPGGPVTAGNTSGGYVDPYGFSK